jgi:hypothetical protein
VIERLLLEKGDKSNSFWVTPHCAIFLANCLNFIDPFLLVLFTARNHRLLAFLLPKAAKGSKNALTPTS